MMTTLIGYWICRSAKRPDMKKRRMLKQNIYRNIYRIIFANIYIESTGAQFLQLYELQIIFNRRIFSTFNYHYVISQNCPH